MSRKTDTAPRLLTDAELDVMTHLWRLGQGTVHDVLAVLPPDRPLAYTTVSTLLRILEQKQVVRSQKEGRGHLYIPLVTREAYQSASLQHLLTRVFEGTPSVLVRRLVEDGELTESQLQELKKLLNQEDAS